MKLKLYSFLLLFSFQITLAQNTPAEHEISDKLEKIASNLDLEPKKKETLLLQLKAQSEKLDYKLGVLISGDYLMILYGESNRHQEGLALAEQLKKVAKGKKDTHGYIADIYRMNALALGYLGLNDACLKDLKTALSYTKDIKDRNTRVYQLSMCYLNMGLHYNLKRFEDKKLRDSLLYTYEKSLEFAKQISDDSKAIRKDLKYDQIGFIEMRLGIFYLEESNIKGSIELAEKHLMDGLKIYQDKKYNIPLVNKMMMLNQVSWLYSEKKEFQKSIEYAKQALELEKQFREPYHRVESFEFLADSYREVNEKEKAKFYLEKYTFLKDSLADVDRKNANITMKKMVAEVDSEHKENSKQQWIIAGLLSLIASISIIIYWRRRNIILRKNYEQMIDKLKKEQPIQSLNTDVYNEEMDSVSETEIDDEQSHSLSKNVISSQTEARILKRLESFEKSEKFLRKDLTVSLLASQLSTNSKYLSEIIKNNKSQSFSNYINNLKINYIVHKLYNEPKYRGYKISYLAEACGYASSQVFVIAFKKITGVTPSYFIQNLNDEHIYNASY
ncbi:helix-turn-helix domain-containing protein [Chryseobacterium aahli]|uniref:helix-turn-helix domain-containing protein n=1 Tax=Chryseobacterium aahli TaxID=1278643 RepID=UPI001F60D729|nr:helix-turn-helix domain-containing protein [Chryseobacterium aahli]MCI3938814.1 helix-turn-helix domain-containing protein [Chryseobacterium aahli]